MNTHASLFIDLISFIRIRIVYLKDFLFDMSERSWILEDKTVNIKAYGYLISKRSKLAGQDSTKWSYRKPASKHLSF